MKGFYHHHSIMYGTNPIYSPIFPLYLLFFVKTFPLVYLYKLSTHFAITCIDLGPIFPRSNSLQVLKPAPLQPSSTLAYIASDFLVLLLSPSITIYICFIFTQDSQFFIQGIQPLMLFLQIHGTWPFSAQPTMQLSSSTQIPMTLGPMCVNY